MADKGVDLVPQDQEGIHKPTGLIDALSEIERFYVTEMNGEPITKDFLTIKGRFGFFSVGFKTGFVGGLVNLLLIPISIGVVDEYIPIFGNHDPGLFDKAFALLLSLSFYLGYALLLTTIRSKYIGQLTKYAIKNLFWGVTAGASLKMVIAFIFFHFMYLFGLEEEFLTRALYKLYPIVKYNTLNSIYVWLLGLRPVFLTSAYFVLLATVLYVSIPWLSVFLASRKTQKRIAMEEKWQ
ncbi:MAG: hypothetical protein HY730_00270 [Candidatus Tectomicrobia bacterium]|uniref:Uncharacterized protein n=1 Tax=Tectimicrobiota bacterium TaxID=2528274 RepID=A0A933LP82_UNCTE|nr:hypothetical protein [Candidatus Tectomicrobia bacterium]